jgi:hypothetical protein
MSASRALALALSVAASGLASSAAAAPPAKTPPRAAAPARDADDDAAFRKRLAALKATQSSLIQVQMAATDDPLALPPRPGMPAGGLVLVANERAGLYTPPLLSPGDIKGVVDEHMADIRACYKKQLEQDPEWADELILDLAVKKTGRVGEVSIAPGRVRRSALGECMMSTIPKWKFPEFTGETDDGVVQEVVNASFPFSFTAR